MPIQVVRQTPGGTCFCGNCGEICALGMAGPGSIPLNLVAAGFGTLPFGAYGSLGGLDGTHALTLAADDTDVPAPDKCYGADILSSTCWDVFFPPCFNVNLFFWLTKPNSSGKCKAKAAVFFIELILEAEHEFDAPIDCGDFGPHALAIVYANPSWDLSAVTLSYSLG